MAPNDRQHSTDFVRSSPGRRKSWRDWIKSKSTRQNSTKIEEQESKQLKKQQHEAKETQEEQLALLRRRSVSFALVIETFHTLALDDYTPEEISASWFLDNEDITYNCEKIRTVSFAPLIETFHTLALDDYTPEEISAFSASWFDDDDYDGITYNCEKIRNVSFVPVIETFNTLALDDCTPEEISASWFFDDDDDDDITDNCENIRTVSFAAVIETFHTLALDDYTEEEISASWFDDDDYDDITDDCENTISKMNKKRNGSINRHKYCIRGLERMTDIGSALANCNKNDSYDAVLEEQDTQWDNQEDDSGERIARFYREVASRRCHAEAHQRGMQDALIAEELILVDEGRKNKDEKEVQKVCFSLGMHQKRKSIQSPVVLSKIVPPAPSISQRGMSARCVANVPRMLARYYY
jgi:hypothetical protein